MDYAPFVLSDLLIELNERNPRTMVKTGKLGPAVLVGHLPWDAAQAWPVRTPYALFPNTPSMLRSGISMDMLCWPLRPRRLIGLLQSVLRVGRASNCELVMAHSSVSKLHARIFTRRHEVSIVDAGSTQGTFVNGQRISDVEPRVLGEGDQVNLGELRLSFMRASSLVDFLTDTPARVEA